MTIEICRIGTFGSTSLDSAMLDKLLEQAQAREKLGKPIPLVERDHDAGFMGACKNLGYVTNVRREGDRLIGDLTTTFGDGPREPRCALLMGDNPRILEIS